MRRLDCIRGRVRHLVFCHAAVPRISSSDDFDVDATVGDYVYAHLWNVVQGQIRQVKS